MHVTIRTLSELPNSPLTSAPSVREVEYISERIANGERTDAGLQDGPIEVLADYRGGQLYLANGAVVQRWQPKTPCGNGLISLPRPGDESEDCVIVHKGKWWRALVEFS